MSARPETRKSKYTASESRATKRWAVITHHNNLFNVNNSGSVFPVSRAKEGKGSIMVTSIAEVSFSLNILYSVEIIGDWRHK